MIGERINTSSTYAAADRAVDNVLDGNTQDVGQDFQQEDANTDRAVDSVLDGNTQNVGQDFQRAYVAMNASPNDMLREKSTDAVVKSIGNPDVIGNFTQADIDFILARVKDEDPVIAKGFYKLLFDGKIEYTRDTDGSPTDPTVVFGRKVMLGLYSRPNDQVHNTDLRLVHGRAQNFVKQVFKNPENYSAETIEQVMQSLASLEQAHEDSFHSEVYGLLFDGKIEYTRDTDGSPTDPTVVFGRKVMLDLYSRPNDQVLHPGSRRVRDRAQNFVKQVFKNPKNYSESTLSSVYEAKAVLEYTDSR